VPVYLRSLGAEDAEVREKAFGALLMTILHQGSLYSATVAAIPFLLRLVAVESHPYRIEAMDLIRMVVDECRFDTHRDRQEARRASGESPPGGTEGEPDLVAAISEILWADIDLLRELRTDDDPMIRNLVGEVFTELEAGNTPP